MALKESGEMYLETIYILSKKMTYVRSLDVAEYMNYSTPSVCRAVGILKKDNYLIMDKENYLYLTDKGKNVAEKTYERHTILTDIFIRLGVSDDIAVADACKIEHCISDETFNALKKHIKI